MRWRGRRQSRNIEDRRNVSHSSRGLRIGSRTRAGGGLGLVGILVVLGISWFTGIDLTPLLKGTTEPAPAGNYTQNNSSYADDEAAKFASVILADTENTWQGILKRYGIDYPEPTLVLFSNSVPSACGHASAATGPFYCGADSKLYIDLSFFHQLSAQLKAPGDFAQAYVLAHEIGHHLQNVLGILPQFHKARRRMSPQEANAMSVRVELQADCYAGIWAHHAARQRNYLEAGDIEEALNAASRIGDDTLQRQAQGYVVPESFNHGTSAQRVRWFRTGFETGDMKSCDTFRANRL